MKRFLSIVMTVVMLLSTLSCLAFTVSAAGDVESISYTLAKPVEFIEGCGEIDYWYGEYEDEEPQEWSHYEYYGQDGDILTVNYTDGSSVDYVYDFYDYEDSDGNEISSWSLWDSDQEFNNQWTAGNSYEFRLSYMGKETTVPVTIVENPVEAIYFEPALSSVVAISEKEFDSNWFWSVIGEQIVPKGSIFVVEYKNGEKCQFTALGDTSGWISGNGDGFRQYFENADQTIEVECWAPHYDPDYETITFGEEYELTFRYMGKKLNHTISFADYEALIESIEFTPSKPYEFIENSGGCFEDWLNPDTEEWETKYFYDEYRIDDEGNILTVNITDGRSVDYIRTEYDGWKSSSGEYLYDSPDCYDYQSINPWTIDGENYFVVKYMNKEVQVPVSVVENPVESISYTPAGTTNWIENDEKYGDYDYYYYFDPETYNEYEYEWFKYEYNKTEGDILTVNNKDGSTVEYIYDGWAYISSDGSEISVKEVKISDNQSYHNQWTAGNTYDINVSYSGFTTTVSVNIIEDPIESISYTLETPIEIIENTNGDWEEGEFYDSESQDWICKEYFEYYIPECYKYISVFTVNYTDGTSKDFIFDEDEWEYYSDDGECFEFRTSEQQDENPWVIGGNNSFKVTAYNHEVDIPVTILENPVESISYTINKPIEIFEYSNGYWDEDEETYYYDLPTLSDYIEKITLNYNDGTTEDFIWDAYEWEYCNSDGKYLDYSLQATQGDEPWVLGGDNSFKIVTCGREVDIPVTIIENPVESVSYTMSNPIEIIENTNGYWDEREYYDEENDEWVYEDYYSYNFEHISSYIEKFTLNYTDGTTEDFIWDEDEGQYCNADGEYLKYSQETSQWKDPWVIGGDNNFKIIVYGKEAEVPVTIIENPVESISYTPSKPIELLENIDGTWWEVTYSDGREYEYFEYSTSKYDICKNGDILTVTYTDGSVTEYVCSLPDEDDSDGYGVFFTDSEGNELPESSALSFSDNQSEKNPWTVGNEYEVTLSYLDKETTVPITIVENTVESISYTPSEPMQLIENADGYWSQEYIWNDGEEELVEYFKYSFSMSGGDILTVNYNDGSSVNYIYDSYETEFVDSDGNKLPYRYTLTMTSDQSGKNQWTAGNSYEFVVSYMDNETTVPVTVSKCDHSWVKGEGLIYSPPSCTEAGLEGEYCEKCGSIREVEIPATGHTASEWIIDAEATCTETGSRHTECTDCGEILETNVILSPGHTASDWIIDAEATCTEVGSKHIECTVCSGILETSEILATGHTEVKDEAVEATCTETGLTEGSHCSVCDAVIVAQNTVPATGHTTSDWIIDAEATCTETGSKHIECTICGDILETSDILATGHTEVKDAAVAATCTETGLTEGSHCSVCDAVIVAQNTVPATGHNTSEWIIVKDSTCTEEGSQYKECTVCKTVVETQVIDKKDHNESGWKTEKKATVNSEGKKYKECTECGEILKTASISQLKCSKPKLKSIENTEYGVKITWGKVSGADSYAVYRKTGSGKYTKIGTTKKTYYTDKKASSGKKYYYIVKAVNEAGSSSSSSSLSKLYLADPTLKTPSSTKKGIVLKWNKITGADGYVVYRKTGSGKYEKIATVKGSTKVTYTDKSAKKGKKYTYKVKAYKSKTYSAYSNTKTIKDKY